MPSSSITLDTIPLGGRLQINVETASGLANANAPVVDVDIGWDKDADPNDIWVVDYPCSDFGEPLDDDDGKKANTFSWQGDGGDQVSSIY